MAATLRASVLSPLRVSSEHKITLIKGGDLIVAGYASVEVVDKQGDKITKEALKDAFQKYMGDPKYRNVQLAHSNIQVGEVIPNYTDSEGRLWKSEVDDVGMFVVVELRNDIEKAKEVAAEIRKGALRGFSIGGQAFKRVRKSDPVHGDYQEISKLELHEVTICEKGINPEATFRILKEDKVNKMTEEDNNVMTQMTDVLGRLEGRLDSMEKGLPWLDGKDDKKNGNGDDDDKGSDDDNGDDKKDKDEKNPFEKKSEYSDVISSEYLDWMETSLKSAGVDTIAARSHFDNVSKANAGSTPEELEQSLPQRTGQVKGRATESGKPSTNALSASGLSGKGGGVKKGNFLTPDRVSESDVEAAYEIYKAAALEQEFKGALENNFSSRYAHERTNEVTKAEAQAFDARGPLAQIQKSIAALTERIENIGTPAEIGENIQKSNESLPVFEVPSTEDLAEMSWTEVHNLANRAFRSD
jgi:HK97 family phage prohead protease